MTPTAPDAVRLVVVPQFTLTVNKTGTGFGNVTSAPTGINCGTTTSTTTCTKDYDDNTTVTLTAASNSSARFTGWSGATCNNANPDTTATCTVTMSQARSVTANFVPVFTLTVNLAGSGLGSVASNPSGINCPGDDCSESYDSGTSVTLTATPASARPSAAGRVTARAPGPAPSP